jgi:16S rRNA (adenine1518-N6/adenine1519-N6)-dimethyltransferase
LLLKHRARKRFGQNFLQDDGIIDAIVKAINPQKGETFIEIGPGLGALTFPMLECIDIMQAVEIDRDLIEFLAKKSMALGRLNLIEADALTLDFNSLGNDLRIIGNLPYNISTPLLLHLFKFSNNINDMHFMLQKEVVLRLCASPGTKAFGRLSVISQYFCDVDYLFTVSPDAFHPKPKVDSAIVRLRPREDKEAISNFNLFELIVAKAFSMRRKTLANNMKGMMDAKELIECNIDPSLRAECLEVIDFVAIANYLNDKMR